MIKYGKYCILYNKWLNIPKVLLLSVGEIWVKYCGVWGRFSVHLSLFKLFFYIIVSNNIFWTKAFKALDQWFISKRYFLRNLKFVELFKGHCRDEC